MRQRKIDASEGAEVKPQGNPESSSLLSKGWVRITLFCGVLTGPLWMLYMSTKGVAKDRWRPRAERDETPYPCRDLYDEEDVSRWADEHIGLQPDAAEDNKKQMVLLLGGSGSGKGTAIRVMNETGALTGYVFQGLDDYLMYLPEYQQSLSDHEAVYKNAADSCYAGARQVAKNALKKLGDTGRPVIYEDTGKNCDRILKRGLPPFMDKGYKLTVVFVDNIPEIAIARASERFQRTGRHAADNYLRGTFANITYCFDHLAALPETSHAVYCDNSCLDKTDGNWAQAANLGGCMRCYHHSGKPVINHMADFEPLRFSQKFSEIWRQTHGLYLEKLPPKER